MIDQSNNKKGIYVVLSESIGSWQAAEFIIKFTLESEKKKFIIPLICSRKVIWPQTYGNYLFSYTYLHNASILASVV